MRVTISLRVAIATLANTLLVGVPVLLASNFLLNRAAESDAAEAIERNMRVAWNELHAQGRDLHIENGRLYAGATSLDGDETVVDRVAELVGGTATIFQGDRRISTNVRNKDGGRAVGTRLARNAAYERVLEKAGPFRGIVDILGVPYVTGYDPIVDKTGAVIGILYVGMPTAQFFKASESVKRWVFLTILACGAVSFLLVLLWSNRGIVGPLRAITEGMNRLAGNDLTSEVPCTRRDDDIGDMGRALEVFRTNALDQRRMEKAEQDQRTMRDRRTKAIEGLTRQFDGAVSHLLQSVDTATEQLQSTAQTMSATAVQTSRQAATVTTTTEETSANVQTVASASEQLAASIQEISRQVTQCSQTSQAAAGEAEQTNAMIRALANSSARIGEVVQLITAIASQTNLLALNATIEAARAGDTGKGFAVVAGEVKNLANQTSRATEDIATQIGEVQSATEQAVQAIAGIVGRIDEINQIISAIAAAVEEQSASTREITRNVHEAASRARQVVQSIADVTVASSETDKAASSVLASSRQLEGEADRLKQEVSTFLSAVRSA